MPDQTVPPQGVPQEAPAPGPAAPAAPESLAFALRDGRVAWWYPASAPALTTEQAAVIVQAQGLRAVADAIEALAAAVDRLGRTPRD